MKRFGVVAVALLALAAPVAFAGRRPLSSLLKGAVKVGASAAPERAAEVPKGRSIRAEGRVITYPGGRLTVGAEMAGTVATVLVKEGDTVKKGDVLVVFKKALYSARVREAWARIAESTADAALARADVKRTQQLAASGSVSRQELERATHAEGAAVARRAAAVAFAHEASAIESNARIVSPIEGTVVARFIDPGATVAAGAGLLEIADLQHVRLEVEVDEFDMGHVEIGAPATVTADAFGDGSWVGVVEEVPNVVVARRLRPQDPAHPTGSGVIDVKVSLPSRTPLKLGQRVNVSLSDDSAHPSTTACAAAEKVR